MVQIRAALDINAGVKHSGTMMSEVALPALSVLIPFYNEAGNVEAVIDEVHEQLQGISIEVICVNDASEDSTGEELERAKAKWPDTVFVYHAYRTQG